MKLAQAFRDGIRAAIRIPAPLMVMFLVTLVTAMALTIPVYAAMDAWVGYRLVAHDLARDFDMLLLLEPLMSNVLQPSSASAPPPAATVLLAMLLTALLAWAGSSLPNILLGGGVLLTYVEGRFDGRRFMWGAWHWMLPFFALSILFALGATLAVGLGAIVLALLGAARSDVLTGLGWVFIGLMYALMSAAFDYARVIAVADGARNVLRALGQAVAFIARRPLASLGVYLLMAALGLLALPLYARLIAPRIPFEWAVAAIAAQQLFILARIWLRLARWASQAALVRQAALA